MEKEDYIEIMEKICCYLSREHESVFKDVVENLLEIEDMDPEMVEYFTNMIKGISMAKDFSIETNIIISITSMNREIWDYIRDPDNFCEASERSLYSPDGADEFDLLSHNSIEDFEKFLKEGDYYEYYNTNTIDYMRNLVKELLETGADLSKVDGFYIDYSW